MRGDNIKKLLKKDCLNISIIITIFFGIILYIVGNDYIYGSTLDWNSQHWAFPEYFRNLFYQTGNLLPNFAFNIGSGQNIYYFSYYGLLSPIILISYLLPFIPMPYYIMGSSIAVIVVSIILIYRWLYNRFDSKVSFVSTMLFMLSGPLILHSHRHIMFMNYMAFLLIGLIGVDKYFENKKSLLIISIFLIIMTSYYYSVGSIIAISCYFVYKYLETNKDIDIKLFINKTFKYILNVFIGILMASIILIPTAYVILNGRGAVSVSVDYLSLFTPSLNWPFLMYKSYSLGLTAIVIYAVVDNLINKDKHNQFLAIIFSLFMFFPVIVYLLNATMYVDAKVLIPFLPLAILMISTTLDRIFNLQYQHKKMLAFLMVGIIMIWILLSKRYNDYAWDFAIVLATFYLFNKFKKPIIIIFPLIIISLYNCIKVNINDKLVTTEQMKYQVEMNNNTTIDNILNKEDSIVRSGTTILASQEINRVYSNGYYQASVYSSTNNVYYNNLYFDEVNNEVSYRNSIITPQSNNVLFNIYMGVKYLIGDNLDIVGYRDYQSLGDNEIYVNNDVFPIAYVNKSLMNIDEYEKLAYPYNVEALMNNVIVEKDVDSNFTTSIESYKPTFEVTSDNLSINNDGSVYNITAESGGYLNLKLDKPIDGQVILIKFDMLYNQSCSKGDTWITINGIKNKLTCRQWKYHNKNNTFEYSISSNELIDSLNVIFAPGEYKIGNIEFYIMTYSNLKDIKSNFDEFVFDKNITKADHIEGNINVTNNGYFILNIPYDNGFEILIDGNKVKYELVNKSFIGFEIDKGNHHIEINYHSPYVDVSKMLSLVGFGLLILVIYKDKKHFL